MDNSARSSAIKVLAFLLEGTTIDAIRFREDHFTLLFFPIRVQAGEIYLHLDSRWKILAKQRTFESDVGAPEQITVAEEQLLQLYSLRDTHIVAVTLGAVQPDLIIEFEDGRIFILNGHDEEYEAWELGTAIKTREADFLIVATPNNGLAVWTPESFT